MEKIEQKIKGYLAMASGMTIAMIVLGIIFVFLPGLSLDVIRLIVTVCLIGAGAYMLAAYGSLSGVVLSVMGLIVMFHPDVMNIFPIILGVYVIISSFYKLRGGLSLRHTAYSSSVAAIAMNVICLACGIIMVIHPGTTGIVFMMVLGMAMIVYGISDFIDVMILNHHIDTVSKNIKHVAGFKQNSANSTKASKEKGTKVSDIPEAKIVTKKKSKK